MTKKDYQAIAKAIHEGAASCEQTIDREGTIAEVPPSEVRRAIVLRLASVLAADNPRFDRARFIEACETGDATAESCGRLKSTACDWDKGCRKHRN